MSKLNNYDSKWVLWLYVLLSSFSALVCLQTIVEHRNTYPGAPLLDRDFDAFFASAKGYWVYGINPYEPTNQLLIREKEDIHQLPADVRPFYYNPLALILLWPYTQTSYATAMVYTFWVEIVILLGIGFILFKLVNGYINTPGLALAITASTLLQNSFINCIVQAQIINLIALLLILVLLYRQRNKDANPAWFWAFCFVVLSIKAQFILLVLPLLFLERFSKGKYVAFLGIFSLLMLLPLLFFKDLYVHYYDALKGNIPSGKLSEMPHAMGSMLATNNLSISALVARFFFMFMYIFSWPITVIQSAKIFYVISAGVLGGLLVFVFPLWKRKKERDFTPELLFLATGWVISFSPFTWVHYLIFLQVILLLVFLPKIGSKLGQTAILYLAGYMAALPFLLNWAVVYPMVSSLSVPLLWYAKSGILIICTASFLGIGVWAVCNFKQQLRERLE